jgi:hypothetical protein
VTSIALHKNEGVFAASFQMYVVRAQMGGIAMASLAGLMDLIGWLVVTGCTIACMFTMQHVINTWFETRYKNETNSYTIKSDQFSEPPTYRQNKAPQGIDCQSFYSGSERLFGANHAKTGD